MAAALSSVSAVSCRTFSAAPAVRPRASRSAVVAPMAATNITPPKGVKMPPREPEAPPSTFGFVENAEIINSRAAMIGFFSLLFLEGIANRSLLDILGIATGNGLNLGL